MTSSVISRCLAAIVGVSLVLGSIGCGGSPTSSTPELPPAAEFLGEWIGFVEIVYVFPLSGETVRDNCDHRWTITAMNGTELTGTYRSLGGTARYPRSERCGPPGTFSGSISSFGVLSGLRFSATLGGESTARDCSIIARPTFVGTISGDSVDARATDTIECFGDVVNRTLTLRSNKVK